MAAWRPHAACLEAASVGKTVPPSYVLAPISCSSGVPRWSAPPALVHVGACQPTRGCHGLCTKYMSGQVLGVHVAELILFFFFCVGGGHAAAAFVRVLLSAGVLGTSRAAQQAIATPQPLNRVDCWALTTAAHIRFVQALVVQFCTADACVVLQLSFAVLHIRCFQSCSHLDSLCASMHACLAFSHQASACIAYAG